MLSIQYTSPSLKKYILIIVAAFSFLSCSNKASSDNTSTQFTLKPGYILFQDMDCGPLCDAIEAVTQGYDNKNISHLGLVVEGDNKELYVLEAIGAGVVETPVDDFLNRSHDEKGRPKVLVAKIKPEYNAQLQEVLKLKDNYLELPYNDNYILNDESYYCSQLIYELFLKANNGVPFFELKPMTFKEPGSDDYFEAWTDYYAKLDCDIPEGLPGINPAGMSTSPKLDIIYAFGELDAKK